MKATLAPTLDLQEVGSRSMPVTLGICESHMDDICECKLRKYIWIDMFLDELSFKARATKTSRTTKHYIIPILQKESG